MLDAIWPYLDFAGMGVYRFFVLELAPRVARADTGNTLHHYYAKLREELGPQGWWPARTRLEIILGAILTQNTAWHNAALALTRLRKAGLLTLSGLLRASRAEIESAIRPAGFFRQKALAIRNFLDWLTATHGGSLAAMFAKPAGPLRTGLMNLRGLGPETVDAIMLYAGRQPLFVADAYTRRILARHELLPANANYAAAQAYLHSRLPAEHALFNEFHALLVEVGKRYCKRNAPHCEHCPLQEFLPHGPALVRGEFPARSLEFPRLHNARS